MKTLYEQCLVTHFYFVLKFDRPTYIGNNKRVLEYKSRPFYDVINCHKERREFENITKCFRNKIAEEILEVNEFDEVQYQLACTKML
jgi:hypothetical protein